MEKIIYRDNFDKMLNKPVLPLLVELSVPTIISMLISNIYNLADTAFVGQLGTSASGAVGIVFGFMAILQSVGFMFGHGSGSIIARHLGARNTRDAGIVVSTGLFCAVVIGFALACLSYLFLDSLVYALGSTETIAPYAKTYIFYVLLAAPAMVGSFQMNNVLRYEGKALLGMAGICIGSVLNIIGDPVLMFGCNMGIAGAGLSTCISMYVSFFILINIFLRGKAQSRLSVSDINTSWRLIWDIMSTGAPSFIRQGFNIITAILLNSAAAAYGDAAVAAMSITGRVSFFVFAIAVGVGQGFQPISGFSYGAGKFSRLRKAFWTMMALAEVIMVVIALIVLLDIDSFIVIFRDDADVIAIASRALGLQLIAQMLLPPVMAVEMLTQSTGRKMAATIISAMKSGLLFIPALIILPYFRGLAGVQEAQPVSTVLSIIPAVIIGWMFFKKLPKVDTY